MNTPIATVVTTKGCDDTDKQVGARISVLRKARGMSQGDLGKAVGVTFQQIQKYEKGMNRVGAGRLQLIAQTLETSVSSFYSPEGVEPESAEAFGFLRTHGAIDLLRAYESISDDEMRRNVLAVVRSAARLGQPAVAA